MGRGRWHVADAKFTGQTNENLNLPAYATGTPCSRMYCFINPWVLMVISNQPSSSFIPFALIDGFRQGTKKPNISRMVMGGMSRFGPTHQRHRQLAALCALNHADQPVPLSGRSNSPSESVATHSGPSNIKYHGLDAKGNREQRGDVRAVVRGCFAFGARFVEAGVPVTQLVDELEIRSTHAERSPQTRRRHSLKRRVVTTMMIRRRNDATKPAMPNDLRTHVTSPRDARMRIDEPTNMLATMRENEMFRLACSMV